MAEILIAATNPISGHPLSWRRGMPVLAFENGHKWGSDELVPPAQGGKFVVVRISDVTVDQVNTFLLNRWGFVIDSVEYAVVTVSPEPIRRRPMMLRVADLPVGVRQQLNDTGFFSTTWPQIRTFLTRISVGDAFA